MEYILHSTREQISQYSTQNIVLFLTEENEKTIKSIIGYLIRAWLMIAPLLLSSLETPTHPTPTHPHACAVVMRATFDAPLLGACTIARPSAPTAGAGCSNDELLGGCAVAAAWRSLHYLVSIGVLNIMEE